MNDLALSVRGLSKAYPGAAGETRALQGVDLDIKRGQLTAVVGPSGAGKTTLLYLLGGLARPSAGEVWVGGKPLFSLEDDELSSLRNRHLGFVFQYHHLLPDLDAADNVALPLRISGLSAKEARQQACELLLSVGLSGRLDHRPGELSGGEQQRVAVARALACKPEVILADEPTGNLDKTNSLAVFALLRQAASQGTAVVMVTHNPELAAKADRVVKMEDGAILS